MSSIWLGVLVAMIVLAAPVVVWLRAAHVIAGDGEPLDELGLPGRENRAERLADPAPVPGEISGPQLRELYAMPPGCRWCSTEGEATLTTGDCACTTPCPYPEALWCQAAARTEEDAVAALLDGLEREGTDG